MKERITSFMGAIGRHIRAHRIITGALVLALAWGGYKGVSGFFGSPAGATYILGTVQKGTLVVSVSGSGQVAATQQVDVKPKTSGEITAVAVTAGQQVRAGAPLAYVDARDAQKAVRDAQINLESAQVALEKLQRNQEFDHTTTTDDLEQAYHDALNRVSSSFLDLPNLMDTVRGILYDDMLKGSCTPNLCEYGNLISDDLRRDFKIVTDRAEHDEQDLKATYDSTFEEYRALRLDASHDAVVSIMQDTEKTATLLAQALKSEQNMFDMLVSDLNNRATKNATQAHIPPQISTYQAAVASAIGTTNSMLSGLSSVRQNIESAQRTLSEGTISNPLDIASQQNIVQQRQAALQDAKDALESYTIRAPFDGVVTKVNIKKGDQVSSGTAVATVITHQRVATLSLNEVDAAKIVIGQKATLKFDAAPDLTIAGQVLDIDTLGTVSQGVVTYGITIGFDTQDERVKPGMSVSAGIIINTKTDALLVPNGAVKTQGNSQYVQVPVGVPAGTARIAASATTLNNQTIQTGLANDTTTEVLDGLTEGDAVVVRTMAATAQTSTAPQAPGGVRIPGGFGGGGGR